MPPKIMLELHARLTLDRSDQQTYSEAIGVLEAVGELEAIEPIWLLSFLFELLPITINSMSVI